MIFLSSLPYVFLAGFVILMLSFLIMFLSVSLNYSYPSLCCLVLSIHMDDQIDGKMLVGSYICTEQPGEFRWQPGSLTQVCFLLSLLLFVFFCYELLLLDSLVIVTNFLSQQAVLNGLWVVFENIDKAPSDVLPILVPLLEGASSFVTSHGEVTLSHSFSFLFLFTKS